MSISTSKISVMCYCTSALSIASLLFAPSTLAVPIPSSLAAPLQQHEDNCGNLSLTWKVAVEEKDKQPSVPITSAQKRRWQELSIKQYKLRGFTDQKAQEMAITASSSMIKQSESSLARNNVTWKFTRNGEQALVTGTNPFSKGSPFVYRQFYQGSNGLIVNDGEARRGTALGAVDPIAWSAVGQSCRYRSPVPFGLSVLPEHFVMLDGLNPLLMYGASWTVTSSTSQGWRLIGKVASSGSGPLTLSATVVRKGSDIVPQYIMIKPDQQPWFATWSVLDYKRQNGILMPKQVSFHCSAPGIAKVDEMWTLIDVVRAGSISLTIKKNTPVQDYRLLGNNLTQYTLTQAALQRSNSVVFYPWQGHFPTSDELQKIYKQQRPGEASPDPGQSGSAMPVAGGACLWLLGNMILMPAPAKGSGNEVQQIPSCTSYTVEIPPSGRISCGPAPQCSGNWSDTYYTPSDCGHGTRNDDGSQCRNGTGPAPGFTEFGTCYPLKYGNNQYICQQQNVKIVPATVYNVPVCSQLALV